MNHLQPIAFVQQGLRPALPRNNVAVQLDRYPIRLHAQLLHQSEKREPGRHVGKIALFSIDMQFHRQVGGARGAIRIVSWETSTRLCGGRISEWWCALRSSLAPAATNPAATLLPPQS